jgi:hypothetical protein
MSLKEKFKQYGFKNALKRTAKFLLRKLGIQYESFLFFVNNIDIDEIQQKMQKYDYTDVKELTLDDFNKGDPSVFNDKKMDLIKFRFESGKYWAYGIFNKDKLVYSCWITTHEISFPDKYNKSITLNSNEGFLVDAYCHPTFRGKGLHSKMNLFRLSQLHKMGKDKNIVLVLSENTPAVKSQLKSGFTISKKISFLKIWNKQFYFEKNK